jgi:hypothetical protein
MNTIEAMARVRGHVITGKGVLADRRRSDIAELLVLMDAGRWFAAYKLVESYGFHCANSKNDTDALRRIEGVVLREWEPTRA